MTKFIFFISLAVIACGPQDSGTQSTQNGNPGKSQTIELTDLEISSLRDEIKDHIQSYTDKGEFSGSVLVSKGGRIIFKGGFGYADYENQIPNRADTKFLIGSTTKSVTALVLLRFVERGLVDLQTPISEYLPQLKKALGNKLSIHHLLKMQSGLPNHLGRLTSIDDRNITSDEIIEVINKSPLSYIPGTEYSYSNLNYHLIAIILENISGLSYDKLLNREVFNPLNMIHSGSGKFDDSIKNRALGYHVGSLKRTKTNNLSFATGSGCIYSTVEDLFKWDQALYEEEYISEESKDMAFEGGTEEFGYYGYGFRIREYTRSDSISLPGKLVRHGGTMVGFLANVHRYLDDKITVIILGNISMFPIRDMTTELKDKVLGISTR